MPSGMGTGRGWGRDRGKCRGTDRGGARAIASASYREVGVVAIGMKGAAGMGVGIVGGGMGARVVVGARVVMGARVQAREVKVEVPTRTITMATLIREG